MKINHLIIEEGADVGKELHIPANGARLGRSEKNDIVIVDPLLSRYHCRFFFADDGSLVVADLASANKTMVNGKEIIEQPIRQGDLVQIGDTVLKVIHAGTAIAAPAETPPANVDLGLTPTPKAKSSTPSDRPHNKAIGKPKLLILAAAILAVVLLVCAIAILMAPPEKTPPPPASNRQEKELLAIEYEKVEADASNIFRYNLTITPDLDISIEIDDLVNNRTVRKEKKLDEELVANLIRQIRNSSFFELSNEYTGIQPNSFTQWILSITINRQTHSVRVLNRPEPDAFKELREEIEVFGKNELGLWAIQFSTEKLLEMAQSAHLTAKSLFAERTVRYSNLFEALQNFQKAVIDLETVEPKPDFYAEALGMITECNQLIQDQYDDLFFQVERSIRLQEWGNAADKLRIIQEIIPDRSDDRNKQARKQLLDVEARIKANE